MLNKHMSLIPKYFGKFQFFFFNFHDVIELCVYQAYSYVIYLNVFVSLAFLLFQEGLSLQNHIHLKTNRITIK